MLSLSLNLKNSINIFKHKTGIQLLQCYRLLIGALNTGFPAPSMYHNFRSVPAVILATKISLHPVPMIKKKQQTTSKSPLSNNEFLQEPYHLYFFEFNLIYTGIFL